MYEAKPVGADQWFTIPRRGAIRALEPITKRRPGPLYMYLRQMEIGRWVLTPTMTIRKVGR